MTDPNATSTVIAITDHARRLVRRLPWRLRRTRTVALLEAIACKAIQPFEWWVVDLLVARLVDTSTGVHLDRWGSIVGDTRRGLTNPTYRVFVLARALINRCDGARDSILEILSIVTAPSTVRSVPLYPAGVSYVIHRDRLLDDPIRDRVRAILEEVTPAGVTIEAIETVEGSAYYLENLGDPDDVEYPETILARVL